MDGVYRDEPGVPQRERRAKTLYLRWIRYAAAARSVRYNFTVYAVDVPSLDLRGPGRRDLERTLKTHTLATARLTGEYKRLR